uniref:Uncharacterized protein n=1 Tax=viral metagenome TaxID=1070528 RepID=A0A6C0CGR3_9ZZZZ
MEESVSLDPCSDDVRRVADASSSFVGFCIPTKKRHKLRGKVGLKPVGTLLKISGGQSGYQSGSQVNTHQENQTGPRVYLDDNRRKWHERSSCCSCHPNRLVHYDDSLISNSQGSSEVSFVVMNDGSRDFTSKTYHYRDRDKSTCCQHFWADIFPIFCYCDCGTRDLFFGHEFSTASE